MPAAPIIGFSFLPSGRKRLSSLAKKTPPAVSKTKATRPSARISRVSGRTNLSAVICPATVRPSTIVMRLASTFWAVSDRAFSTPHSRSRLPNIKKPTSATLAGATRPASTVTTMGKRILVVLLTLRLLVGHPDPPLFLGGAKADDRRLHDGNQRHIAVGRHHDSAQILAAQRVGDKDGRGAVCRADDGDGGCVRQVEAEQPGQHQRDKDAQLRRRAEQHQPRLFQQRAEVDHGTDADEEQQREQLVGHTRVEQKSR